MKNIPGPRKYPKFLTIRGEVWQVKFKHDLDKLAEADPEDCPILGLCDPSNKTIYLRYKQSKIDLLKTFVHEVLHAIEDEYDFSLPHGEVIEQNGRKVQLPDVVDYIERGVVSVLYNNFL